jgi:hypothetical protein
MRQTPHPNPAFLLFRQGIALGLLCLTVLPVVYGQTLSDLERSRFNTAAYYNYAETGDVTVRVHVWGGVRNPGLYEIPQGTRMSTLFSLAGGPAFLERREKDTRTLYIRLSRQQGTQREVAYEATMQNQLIVTAEDPVLLEGDVLTAEAVLKQGFTWRDIIPVVNTIALIALAIERFASAAN